MSISTPVTYRTTIPPRQLRGPPTSPDSLVATPSSSPIHERSSATPIPYVLAPDSRPTSPTSQARIDKLAQQIRNRDVLALYVISAKLRGPFGPGASSWGTGYGIQESYDDEDLVLPESEEHAIELERQRMQRRGTNSKQAPDIDRTPRPSQDAKRQRSSSSRSTTLPVWTLSTPQATSTPASALKHSYLQPSASQSRLGFSLSKPAIAQTHSKDGPKSSSQPNLSPRTKRGPPRFATMQDKLRTTHTQLRSSQPTPFNSQFDVDQSARELSNLLGEDGFEVDRGVQGVVVISSDDD